MKLLSHPRRLAGLSLFSCAFLLGVVSSIPASAAPQGGGKQAERVSVTKPARVDLERRVPVIGSVMALRSADLVPRVTGFIEKIHVHEGQVLKAGDPIASIDVPDLDAALALARAELAAAGAQEMGAEALVRDASAVVEELRGAQLVAVAEVDVAKSKVVIAQAEASLRSTIAARRRLLRAENAATDEEVEEAQGALVIAEAAVQAAESLKRKADAAAGAAGMRILAAEAGRESAAAGFASATAMVGVAEAMLQQALAQRSFAELTCPYEEGVVTRQYLDEGALVTADQSMVVRVVDVSQVRVLFHLPESDCAALRPGATVIITLDDRTSTPITSTIALVSGALNPATRTMRAEARLDNADRSLLPGMFCHAQIIIAKRTGCLTVPGNAVRTSKDGVYVMVVEDGKAVRKSVTLGIDDGILVELTSGLDDDADVIVRASARIRSGDPVTAVPVKEAKQ